jgi:GntR family transcriptional regulator of vanillate catabolism
MDKTLKPGQHVIVALRKMIASGELADGARIGEIATAERLGVSRMPVRTALRALEQEGLVVQLGARGYAARGPTAEQIDGAIEVRGVLEGLAARIVASRPAGKDFRNSLSRSIETGDALFAKGSLVSDDLERFYDYNIGFHDLLVRESGNQAIAIALSRNNHLPFASAAALALDWQEPSTQFRHLLNAHEQHKDVADAILGGRPDDAERHMRHHARASVSSASVFERFGIELQLSRQRPVSVAPGPVEASRIPASRMADPLMTGASSG